jgi:hypothetical protein
MLPNDATLENFKKSLVGPNEFFVLWNHPPCTNLEAKKREIILYMNDLKEQSIALDQ